MNGISKTTRSDFQLSGPAKNARRGLGAHSANSPKFIVPFQSVENLHSAVLRKKAAEIPMRRGWNLIKYITQLYTLSFISRKHCENQRREHTGSNRQV